jgi:hypothetical protein
MRVELNGFAIDLSVLAWRHGHWSALPLMRRDNDATAERDGLRARLSLRPVADRIDYEIGFNSDYATRLRLRLSLVGEQDLFHLIPGNIHGDNNAAHVLPGQFPVLCDDRLHERNRAPLWEFRADRASHPVSVLCCGRGAVAVSVAPYSDCSEYDEGFVRNGVFAELPHAFGVSAGYGNDPLTFSDKTVFLPATSHLSHGVAARGSIYAFAGEGRNAAHRVIRAVYQAMRERPTFQRRPREALHALSSAFTEVSYEPGLGQYTNRKCEVPTDITLRPWRAIVEIGWTGGSMMAYPFTLAERLLPGFRFPKSPETLLDEIAAGLNPRTGFINDTTINSSTRNIPDGWNTSTINGWWSGFLSSTRDNHCAYTNGQAAYYLLATAEKRRRWKLPEKPDWNRVALRVLDRAIELQREDGAFGYIFSGRDGSVVDYDGFAGCWFTAALPLAWQLTDDPRYRAAAERSLGFYHGFVRNLACWGSPMDTCKSIDSEGNLAFLRAAKLMHAQTGDDRFFSMLRDSACYEYLWRYGFRARPECPPLKGSHWNSCGGSITSVSNPHVHPMSVVATSDLEYLARATGDGYHADRAEDGFAWLMNTLELYPDVVGYGRYGLLSERTCPSDGLLSERYRDTDLPASTWWSYNAWAAASAMEGIAERLLSTCTEGPG